MTKTSEKPLQLADGASLFVQVKARQRETKQMCAESYMWSIKLNGSMIIAESSVYSLLPDVGYMDEKQTWDCFLDRLNHRLNGNSPWHCFRALFPLLDSQISESVAGMVKADFDFVPNVGFVLKTNREQTLNSGVDECLLRIETALS
jgi:hypothetical protein